MAVSWCCHGNLPTSLLSLVALSLSRRWNTPEQWDRRRLLWQQQVHEATCGLGGCQSGSPYNTVSMEVVARLHRWGRGCLIKSMCVCLCVCVCVFACLSVHVHAWCVCVRVCACCVREGSGPSRVLRSMGSSKREVLPEPKVSSHEELPVAFCNEGGL